MLLLKPESSTPPTECRELEVLPRRGWYRPPVELGLFVHSDGLGNGNEDCGGFGDKNSKLSSDRRGDLGEDIMIAAPVGGAVVTEAWGECARGVYRMAGL
jgi:hypothetical protein